MDPTMVNLIKGGENVIRVRLVRGTSGIKVTVWTHSSVEELLASWGEGLSKAVRTYDRRNWTPIGLETEDDFRVYDMHYDPGMLVVDPMGPTYMRLNQVGSPIISDDGITINLSPLRLVGTSKGSGVSFNINGVYSVDGIRQAGKMFQNAALKFYTSFLKPVDLTVTVSTQEIPTIWGGGR